MFGHHAERGSVRYQMRERLISIGDDYTIKDESGQDAFKVDGKVMHVRKTLKLKAIDGTELLQIQGRLLHVRDTMVIENAAGAKVATIKRALISPIHHRFAVDVEGQDGWSAEGNFLAHEYEIKRGRDVVARVSKKWFRVSDVYGVEIAPDFDTALALAATVVIDEMMDPGK